MEFMLGASVMASAAIGLFFLRFWRKAKDGLFFFFAIAFWLLGLNWLLLAFSARNESHTELYIIRLLAFGLIILGIGWKNRKSRRDGESAT